ncbi:MAG: hypothetical protein KKA19_01090 [Candidatus Margulisbacteria bacterium]|nr:hypothetical protein [Candidatus Margulisiibacteriota bacterium]
MPIYKWNEVRERKELEQLAKQKEFPRATPSRGAQAESGPTQAEITEAGRRVAQEIKDQAEHDAEEIKQRAQTEIEEIKKRAYAEGKKAASQEIYDKFKENLQKSLDTIQEALDERKRIIKTAEPEILKLAIKIAQQIIHSEITLNRGVIMNVVADAINKITDREQVIIKVNQADLEQVKEYKEDIEDMLDGAKNLSIVNDKKVEQGGCVIETMIGLVDAKVSTKLGAIEKAFMKVYSEDVKKVAVKKGEKVDTNEMYRLTGEVLEGAQAREDAARKKAEAENEELEDQEFSAEEAAEPNKVEKKEEGKEEESFDFDTEDLDLDLDFDEDDMSQTG